MGLSEGFEVDLHLESDDENDPIKLHITGVIKPIPSSFAEAIKEAAQPSANPYQPK